MRSWLKDVAANVAATAIVSIAVVVGLAIYAILGSDVTLPAWTLALIVLSVLIVGFLAGWHLRRDEQLEREALLGRVYGEHVRETLNTLQRAITGDIDGVTVETFVQKGILDPARNALTQGAGEEIRLSVLEPAPDDPLCWAMVMASGHSLGGQRKFRLEISSSFAGRAYAEKATAISDDVQNDPRFTANSFARPGREYGSIIAVPLMDGDDCFGVLSVISTFVNAFSDADQTYVEVLGAIIGVALSVGNDRAEENDPEGD